MGKLLLLALVIAVLWWIIRGSGRPSAGPRRAPAAEDMVRCAQCGVHLPRSESYARGSEFFCSEEHLRLHR
ncbi:MAG TPA: PP0621 family protein [Burkholderiales bacterium]|nr:PP0621 family protein [Burkholderiales bacterium]